MKDKNSQLVELLDSVILRAFAIGTRNGTLSYGGKEYIPPLQEDVEKVHRLMATREAEGREKLATDLKIWLANIS